MSKSLPIKGKEQIKSKSSTTTQINNVVTNGKLENKSTPKTSISNVIKSEHPSIKSTNGNLPQKSKITSFTSSSKKPSSNPGPEELFELLSKNYENWSQAMTKQFEDEENFSPFPNENDSNTSNKDKMNPIFNYSLLEALETASNEIGENLKDISNDKVLHDYVVTSSFKSSNTNGSTSTNNGSIANRPIKHPKRRILHPSHSLLNEKEIVFLRDKITQIIKEREEDNLPQGFTLYDTKDEKGLNDDDEIDDNERAEFCSCCDHSEYDYDEEDDDDYNNQNDYDLNDFNDNNDKRTHFNSHRTHSIEIELNTAPDCDIHGSNGCDCPIFESSNNNELERRIRRKRNYMGSPSDNDYDSNEGPSCEFTFEYDHNGQLIPTYSNIEEKLRLMKLETSMKSNSKQSIKNNKSTSIKTNKTVKPKPLIKQDIKLKQNQNQNADVKTSSNSNSNTKPTQSKQSQQPKQSQQQTKTQVQSKPKTKPKKSKSKSPSTTTSSTIPQINPLNDLKKLQKLNLSNDILKKYRLRNLQSTTPKNFYGLIPNDKCCLLCQYEAIFGCKPKYIYSKK
ncbi:uncharacterized protein KGF55_001634 [Candida pseudojiufengensis]|uniref:uncharacterized protein n=1 Tax=Candida pseudojiufengensis TaxID=497109 RepID=UPI002224AA0A|nr:uncharacterized protein KGF55_001634 [Candida pseudojiufengensis]KAI5964565.1 hypothetical protein KGF55_001634 [Candida pseudojiufengensis]